MTKRKERDMEMLNCIYFYQSSWGINPTYRDLGILAHLSSLSSVSNRLDHLEDAGLVKRVPNDHRSVQLTEIGRELAMGVPND